MHINFSRLLQTWFDAVHSNFCLRCDIASQRLLRRIAVCTPGWPSLDTSNVGVGIFGASVRVRYGIFHQFHCHLLPCIACNSLRHYGCGRLYLHFCDSTVELDWNDCRKESGRSARFPVSRECRAAANTREEMVHGAGRYNSVGWRSTIRFDFHRNVLHFHIVLGIQNLLRVRLHVAGVHYFGHCYCLRDNCLHIFPTQCRRLSMAMDQFYVGCINCYLRIRLLILLLLL